MTPDQIKKDLRKLRKLAHSIEVASTVKERHVKRKEILMQSEQTEDVLSEIARIDRVLATLRIEEHIKQATALEERYMEAISRLDPLDKTIILDGYINGKAYWKIGRDIGYTEDGIKKRVAKIIEKIAEILQQ